MVLSQGPPIICEGGIINNFSAQTWPSWKELSLPRIQYHDRQPDNDELLPPKQLRELNCTYKLGGQRPCDYKCRYSIFTLFQSISNVGIPFQTFQSILNVGIPFSNISEYFKCRNSIFTHFQSI